MLDEARLDEYDEDEWYSICRSIKPQLSREEFHVMWVAFQINKAARLETIH